MTTTHRRRCSTCGIESEIGPGVSVVPVDLRDARAEVARLTAKNEQLQAEAANAAYYAADRDAERGEVARLTAENTRLRLRHAELETIAKAERDALTAENEQLRAKGDQYAKSWQIIDTENNDLRARVQAVLDLCATADSRFWHPQAPFVTAVRAAIGDGDDRD